MQQHSSSAQHPPGQDTGSTTTTTVISGTADTPATIHRIVFTVSALLTLALIGFTLAFPGLSEQVLGHALAWVSDRFGWYYMLIVAAYGIFSLYVGMSKYGDIKLGQDHEKPDFPYLAWAAMLFSAGIGIDLLFFGVSEPLSHYITPVTGQGSTPVAARAALAQTFLHWGLHGWGIYALIGMALAYFAYRHNLPLALRSALVPVFGQKRADGWLGHSVDIFGVVCTLLGLATSLGIGVLQANAGLAHVFGIETTKFTQAVIIIIVTVTAAASAMSGVDKGVRRLSEFNMLTAILLVIALLLAGPTQFLLNAMVQNIGDYFETLPVKTFETYAYEGAQGATWKSTWTIFFWAWWVAWAPFVGLFIARISRGRTLREFVFGVMFIPLGFIFAWFSIFGNSGIFHAATDPTLAKTAIESPAMGLFALLRALCPSGHLVQRLGHHRPDLLRHLGRFRGAGAGQPVQQGTLVGRRCPHLAATLLGGCHRPHHAGTAVLGRVLGPAVGLGRSRPAVLTGALHLHGGHGLQPAPGGQPPQGQHLRHGTARTEPAARLA